MHKRPKKYQTRIRHKITPELKRLVIGAYRLGMQKQKALDLEVINRAIDTCKTIECWSEAARRARNEIMARK